MEARVVKEWLFREDLYYRLKLVRVQTPALRVIAEDIPIVAKYFLAKHCEMMNIPLKEFTSGVATHGPATRDNWKTRSNA